MTFRQFLDRTHAHQNAAGDFIRDARRDWEMPEIRSLAALTRYLHQRSACHAAVVAGARVWQRYARLRRQA